jgi:hypothetical protein
MITIDECKAVRADGYKLSQKGEDGPITVTVAGTFRQKQAYTDGMNWKGQDPITEFYAEGRDRRRTSRHRADSATAASRQGTEGVPVITRGAIMFKRRREDSGKNFVLIDGACRMCGTTHAVHAGICNNCREHMCEYCWSVPA